MGMSAMLEKVGGTKMRDGEFGMKRRGDERLMRACFVADTLCAERVSATERLEAQLGEWQARGLVKSLASRRSAPKDARYSNGAVHGLAA